MWVSYAEKHNKKPWYSFCKEYYPQGIISMFVLKVQIQPHNRYFRKTTSKNENITEEFKAKNPMLWCSQLNNIRERAIEIVSAEVIYI